jgi:hypothetical protein
MNFNHFYGLYFQLNTINLSDQKIKMIENCVNIVRMITETIDGQLLITIAPCGKCVGCQVETRTVKFM